jgi:hypothetical protein
LDHQPLLVLTSTNTCSFSSTSSLTCLSMSPEVGHPAKIRNIVRAQKSFDYFLLLVNPSTVKIGAPSSDAPNYT